VLPVYRVTLTERVSCWDQYLAMPSPSTYRESCVNIGDMSLSARYAQVVSRLDFRGQVVRAHRNTHLRRPMRVTTWRISAEFAHSGLIPASGGAVVRPPQDPIRRGP